MAAAPIRIACQRRIFSGLAGGRIDVGRAFNRNSIGVDGGHQAVPRDVEIIFAGRAAMAGAFIAHAVADRPARAGRRWCWAPAAVAMNIFAPPHLGQCKPFISRATFPISIGRCAAAQVCGQVGQVTQSFEPSCITPQPSVILSRQLGIASLAGDDPIPSGKHRSRSR
jgi:hypothetical protein